MKTYSNWPTYPQVYVKGELIGGLDIIKEIETNDEISQTFPIKKKKAKTDIETRLKEVIFPFF